MTLRICKLLGAAALALATCVHGQILGSGGPYQVFMEYFSQAQAGANWTINSPALSATGALRGQNTALRWQLAGETPGFHYYNYGQGYAYAPWSVGAQSFDVKCDIAITYGYLHEWVRNGVFFALSTEAPGHMDANAISAVIAIQGAGPAASVRKGILFTKDTELSNISKWPAGGDVESIAWPNSNLPGTQLTVEMQRNGNVMSFYFFRPDYLGGQQPWWSGSWQLPGALLHTSFNYLMAQTLNTDTTNSIPAAPYAYQGVVSNIRGYVMGGEAPPSVASVLPVNQTMFQSGATITISGQGFQPGASVWIGNQYLPATYISSTQLTCVLPALAAGPYIFKVINPSGLEGQVAGGVTYTTGPLLLQMNPREVSPAGGDLVTVVGAGFDSSTKISINGQPAAVAQLIDCFHIQVQVPAGKAGTAAVTATGTGAFTGSPAFGYAPHPYMYYTASTLASLQSQFANPAYANYSGLMTRNATDADPTNPQGAVGDYLWPYLYTQNAQFRASLFTKINQELSRIDFTDFRLADAGIMATAYDTLFGELTPAQRTALLSYLDRAYAVYNQMRTDNVWFLGPSGGNMSNTTAVGNGGGGLIALSLEYSTAGVQSAVADAIKRITPFANQCIGPDGGDVEGALYWSYGLTWYLQFAHVLKSTTGNDHALLTQPNLATNYRFVQTMLSGDGSFLTFNDSEPQLYGMAVMADLGNRFNQPLMLWMADYEAAQTLAAKTSDESTRYDIVPYAFLWRGSTLAPSVFPGVPASSVLSNAQWGVMRSDSSQQPNLVVGVKAASTVETHHAQNDAGGFVLQASGEGFLIDPGYYQPAAAQHTVPLIDGSGPGIAGGTVTKVRDDGVIRSMLIDATAAYGTGIQRVRRLVTTYLDRAAIVLDDIVPASGQPGRVISQFQAGYPASLTGGTGFFLQGRQSSVAVALYGPAAGLAVKGPLNLGSSWIFAAKGVQWYAVNAAYTAAVNAPLVTVITPNPKGAAGVTASVTYSSGQITVNFSDGESVSFSQGTGGWTLN